MKFQRARGAATQPRTHLIYFSWLGKWSLHRQTVVVNSFIKSQVSTGRDYDRKLPGTKGVGKSFFGGVRRRIWRHTRTGIILILFRIGSVSASRPLTGISVSPSLLPSPGSPGRQPREGQRLQPHHIDRPRTEARQAARPEPDRMRQPSVVRLTILMRNRGRRAAARAHTHTPHTSRR